MIMITDAMGVSQPLRVVGSVSMLRQPANFPLDWIVSLRLDRS